MCRIVGIAGKQEPQLISQMNAVMRHRGPDDQGEYRDQECPVSLAMHQLSIPDPVGGTAPD